MDSFAPDRPNYREMTEELRQTRDFMEKLHHQHLSRAADLGNTLSQLTSLLSLMDTRSSRVDDMLEICA